MFNNGAELTLSTGTAIGTVRRGHGFVEYVDYLARAIGGDLTGLNIAIDRANGAASACWVPGCCSRLSAACRFIGTDPDGGNINGGCGSTHLISWQNTGGQRAGLRRGSFDGDADRCLAVDEKGREIDGDKIIAILAKDLKDAGKPPGGYGGRYRNEQPGFIEYMKQNGMKTAVTAVGDRYAGGDARQRLCHRREQSDTSFCWRIPPPETAN